MQSVLRMRPARPAANDSVAALGGERRVELSLLFYLISVTVSSAV